MIPRGRMDVVEELHLDLVRRRALASVRLDVTDGPLRLTHPTCHALTVSLSNVRWAGGGGGEGMRAGSGASRPQPAESDWRSISGLS